MKISQLRRFQSALAAAIVASLALGLAGLSAPPAHATSPPITFALSAIETASGNAVAEVESGTGFSYSASVGCPDPNGCGPASLVVSFPDQVEFVEGGLVVPDGATASFAPASNAPGAPGGTLTISWADLGGTSMVYLPARVSPMVGYTLNGSPQTASASLTAGAGHDELTLSGTASVRLRIYETPGLTHEANTWADARLADGSQALTSTELTAVAAGNSTSTLVFLAPNSEDVPSSTLPAAEAFDLLQVTLSQNPAGAEVVFTLADGTTVPVVLQSPATTATAPANAVGYLATVADLPPMGPDPAETEASRTVTVTADHRLRDTQRSGGRIVDPSLTSRQVRMTADITARVTDAAPGQPASVTRQLRSNTEIGALLPTIEHALEWTTASGDSTSVYESGEASTVTVTAANSGEPVLRTLTIALPHSNSRYFEIQRLSVEPDIRFPAGATTATVRYNYAGGLPAGQPHAFGLGEPVPGPDSDGPEFSLAAVSGITVTFSAPDSDVIAGNCAPTDACSAQLLLNSVLRDTELTSGAPISPPKTHPGATEIGAIAQIRATAATGTNVQQATNQALLTLVKPQFIAKLSKVFGDGSDRTVYPLTGVAKSGDHFDPNTSPQNFADHDLRFVAATSAAEGATERPGARELTILDPQTTPTIEHLGSNPFNAMKFTSIAADDVVCTAPDDTVIGSTTTQHVWVLDALAGASSIKQVPFDADIDLELVVGLELTITPTAASGRFPIDVRCVSADGTAVKFRDTRVSDGAIVSPASIGADDTPGLFALGNTAELLTGTNTATAIGGDSLYLVDLINASVYKHFAKGAAAHGVQGQGSPTAFLLSAVPASEQTRSARITDGHFSGGTMVRGQSFDIFALTGVRDAHLGPDQSMSVTFRDRNGALIGPTGSVAASTSLAGTELEPAAIEDSQSPGYLAFQRVKRDLEWAGNWSGTDMASVASVRVEVSRADETQPLQRYGAFSVVVDASLRSHLLSDGTTEITGSPGGTLYSNVAAISSREGAGPDTWTNPIVGTLEYSVFATTGLFAHAEARWTDAASPGDHYLVAQHQTPSQIALTAENRTAVGVAGGAPENQWELTGSIAVGMDRLTVGVGGPASSGRNPFAITDFAGVTGVVWPVKAGADAGEPNAARRVAGTITYTFATGPDLTVPAPVGAAPSELNPPQNRWGDVVGVSASWAEPGKFVGTSRKGDGRNAARLTLRSDLRDVVRDGYHYGFAAGIPADLQPGESIDGAQQNGEDTVDQLATLDATVRSELSGLPTVDAQTVSNELMVDVARSAVEVSTRASGGTLFRDRATLSPQAATTWTLTNRNSGNIPVSGLWLATDSALLDRATWPDEVPAGYALPTGSALDAFDIVAAELRLPEGAASASAWALGADGAWTSEVVVTTSQSRVTLPTSGPGPTSWGDVTGVRVQFDSAEGTRTRVAKGASGSLILRTQLRERLRTQPQQLAPATNLPDAADRWLVPLSAAGTSHVGTPGSTLDPLSTNAASQEVRPGTPLPVTGKYTRAFDPSKQLPPTNTVGHPGSWVNFFVTVRNEGTATSNMYDLSVVDSFPSELRYNAASPAATWSVVAAPQRFGEPEMTLTAGSPTEMRWDWRGGEVLKPGEHVMLRVPLQVSDGMPAGGTATNVARTIASGIYGAAAPSVCASAQSAHARCRAEANVSSARNDGVRAESYVNASALGAATAQGEACDPSTVAEWVDGTWVRNPCVAETTAGDTLAYRIKLINSGNIELADLRFVDELPKTGDRGTVLNSPRGSEWTPELVPGSVRLLTGGEAADLGARGDASLAGDAFRFSATPNPCALDPDAYGGAATLGCDRGGSDWSPTAAATTQALGADIRFDPSAKLRGGEFVIVEFEMTVPSLGSVALTSWNTAAVTGRQSRAAQWLPASESPRSGARTQDTSLTLNLTLEPGPATRWHLGAEFYNLVLSCMTPGAGEPEITPVRMAGIASESGVSTTAAEGLPRGGTCAVIDEAYLPTPSPAPGQYGFVSAGVTGYSFSADPQHSITLNADGAENAIAVSNRFAEASVDLGVEIDGDAAGMLPEDATFTVGMVCSFGGIEDTFGPYSLRSGASKTVTGLPVGAACTATEFDHRGATAVTAFVDGEATQVTEDRSVTLPPLEPGAHAARFLNTFTKGGALTVLKRVEIPGEQLAVGDVEFALSCELGGLPLSLGEHATLRHTFAQGEREAQLSVEGIPSGASCSVHESEAGGADVAAPDRTVTVLPRDEVIVEMLNTFQPAALELRKQLAGPGAREDRVPDAFDIRSTCTRELTIAGERRTVTDFDGVSVVSPGQPVALAGLPAGSRCAVTEPDARGAESSEFVSLTAGVPDQDPSADRLVVRLAGPDREGTTVPTRVQVTNRYAATVGLGETGGHGWQLAGGVGALLLGLGGLALGRRHGRNSA